MNITMINKEYNTKITLPIETMAIDLIDMGITKKEDIRKAITLTDEEMEKLLEVMRS